MKLIQNNAMAVVPIPGPYYDYIYFSDAQPLFYKKIFKF